MKFYENYSLEDIKYVHPDGTERVELWEQIEDFEYYHASNLGRVKSLSRKIIRTRASCISKPKILKSNIDRDGYLLVTLRKDGKSFKRKKHRLVAICFIPNPENKPEVNHKKDENGVTDKGNNCYWMIEWNTGEENRNNAMADGLIPKGEKHHSTTLTEQQVLEIKENKDKLTHRELGEIYGVGRSAITKIINGYRWKHL